MTIAKKIRLSDFVINFFEKKNIEFVFTVNGGGSIFLCDSLYRAKNIKYIPCHHEQAVAIAAESYARFTNKPTFAVVTTGPGGTNTLTGVAGCWTDSVPVIFISGQVFSKQMVLETKIRQKGLQEINIVDMVKPITKYAKTITNPSDILLELEKAYYTANDGRPGPIWLDLPADIQNAWIDPSILKKFNPIINKTKSKSFNKNHLQQIKLIAKKIYYSKKPLLLFGRGCQISNSVPSALQLINDFDLPYCLSWNGSDGFPNTNKYYLGKPGIFTQRYANFSIQNCDLFLSIGSRLNYGVTGYNSKDFARNAYKVMVDIDQFELNDAKKRIGINNTLCLDANIFIKNLYIELLKLNKLSKKPNRNIWHKYLLKLKNNFPLITNKITNQREYVNSYFFINLLSKKLKNNSVVVTDMGLSFVCTNQTIITKSENQRHFSNAGHAPMGWGLPGAIGACFANNKKKVICITGDGGLQMNVQELATISHYKLPIIIFLYNNKGYSTIIQTQKLGFNSRIMGSNKKSGLSFPNFELLAKAYSIKYQLIKNNNGLKKLDKIISLNQPIFCELLIDPNQLQAPKLINRRTKDNEIAIPSKFEDLHPFLSINQLMEANFNEK